jgi:hypothetical membrane protein
MAQQTINPESTKSVRLLVCGVVAGSLFLATWLIQALTRDGFDPTYHPISLLSLGSLGWVQILNFVVTGALFVACAGGMRRALRPGRGSTWGPRLLGANGVGLIVAGVFLTDAGAGFPPGVPAGAPERISWHGLLHEVGFIVASVSWLVLCVVLLRRFAADKRRGWVVASIVAPLAVLVVEGWPDVDTLALRLVIGSAISFGFVAALTAWLARGVAREASPPQLVAHGTTLK